jgi:hypothetical protein
LISAAANSAELAIKPAIVQSTDAFCRSATLAAPPSTTFKWFRGGSDEGDHVLLDELFILHPLDVRRVGAVT